MIDKGFIGMESKLGTFTVERGHIKQFAAAVSATKPEYLAGYVAPPTFLTALIYQEGNSLYDFMAPLNLAAGRGLHAEQEFQYFAPVLAGDELVFKTQITDIYEKQGKAGVMEFIGLEMIIFNQHGEKVAVARSLNVQLPA